MAAARLKGHQSTEPRIEEDGSRTKMIKNTDSAERHRTIFQWIFEYCLRHGLDATSEGRDKIPHSDITH